MKSIITTITIILFMSLQAGVYGQSEKFEYAHVSIGFKLNGKTQIKMISPSNRATDLVLKGDDNKPLKFGSYIEALNHMGDEGWEVIQTLDEGSRGLWGAGTSSYAYLMKRKKG